MRISKKNIIMLFALLAFSIVSCLYSFPLRKDFPELLIQQNQEEQDYALIQGLLKDELNELAIKRIEEFLQSYPESRHGEALSYRLGELYLKLQLFPKVVQSFSNFIEKYPQSSSYQSAYFLLAAAYQMDNKLNDAERLFQDIINQKNYQEDLKLEAQQRLAGIYASSGRLLEAAELLEKLIDKNPNIELKVKLADIYFQLRELKKGKKLYQKLLEQKAQLSSEQIIKINYNLALIYYNDEDYDKASRRFNAILQADPSHRQAVIGLSWCYYQQKEYQSAYDLIDRVTEKVDTTPSQDLLRQGEVFLQMHEYQGAISSFSQILEGYPADPLVPQAYLGLGNVYLKQGKIKEAIEYLEHFCSTTKNEEAAYKQWYTIGEIYLNQLQDYTQAIRAYTKTINLNEMGYLSDIALMKVIESHIKLQQYNQAVEAIKLLVKKYPQSQYRDDGYYLLGRILDNIGEPLKAIESYKVVVESFLDSEFRELSQFNAGRLYFQLEDWQQVLDEFSFFLKEFKKSRLFSKAHYYVGMTHYKLGNYKEGIQHFNNILQSLVDKDESQVSFAIFYIGWGYYKLHQYQKAADYFNRMLKKYPHSSQAEEALYWLGWCYLAQEKYTESNQHFSRLISQFPHAKLTKHTLWLIGNNYISLGENSNAIKVLMQLIKDFPQSDFALLAHKKIEEIYLKTGDYKNLLNYLPAFAFNNPASFLSAEKQLAKADKLLKRRKTSEAIKVYKQLLNDFPRSPVSDKANYSLGNIYYEQKNLEEAIIYFRNVVDYFPQSILSPDSHHKLGNCYFQLERFAEAIEHYKQILDHPDFNPVFDRLSYLIGYAFEQLRDIHQAATYYRLYLENISDQTEMVKERIRLILLLQTLGDYQTAIDACYSILNNTNDEDIKTEVQFYLGECYRLWGKMEQAIIEYLKVTYLHSSNDMWALTARFKAGEIYQSQQKYKEAIKLYAKVAEKYKGTKQGDFAQQRIEEINKILFKKEKGKIKEEKIKP